MKHLTCHESRKTCSHILPVVVLCSASRKPRYCWTHACRCEACENGGGKPAPGCLRQLVTKNVTYWRQLEGRYWPGMVVSELQFHMMLPLLVTGESTSLSLLMTELACGPP